MRINQIYNPNRVREGWFECNFITPWFRRFVDFQGAGDGKSCALALLAWLIATAGVAGVLMGLVGLLGPDVGFIALYWIGGLWVAYSLIPLVALVSRTLSGRTDDEEPVTRMLPIDWMLTGCAMLFFLFGLLMMTTTLNSETLHAPTGTDGEEESSIPRDTIVEEAIFTYQNPEIDTSTPASDTMSDLNEPDIVAPDQVYDPTIEPDPEHPDTVNYF